MCSNCKPKSNKTLVGCDYAKPCETNNIYVARPLSHVATRRRDALSLHPLPHREVKQPVAHFGYVCVKDALDQARLDDCVYTHTLELLYVDCVHALYIYIYNIHIK